MAVSLDTLQQRVIGVLIEKALTVPESYPLTMNALIAGCNQKSNRDPQMQVDDFDVEGAVRALMDSGWISRREPEGGRVHRYAHCTKQQLGVERAGLAILCELLCRGPQAPGAIKTRASRMNHFAGLADVEEALRDMASRPVPYVVQLPKLPREQKPRWAHLLDGRTPEEALGAGATEQTTAPVAAHSPEPSDLAARVATLEEQVAELQRRLEDLT